MPQRIAMLTIGSRGDVQPFVALGKGLQAAGYEAVIGTHAAFEDFVSAHGVGFAPVAGDPLKLLERLASDKAGSSMFTFIQQLNAWFADIVQDVLRDSLAACQGADLVIYAFLNPSGPSIAEKLDVPAMAGYLMPFYTPTTAYPGVTMPESPVLRSLFNRLSHQIERIGVGMNGRNWINPWRRSMGLQPYSYLNFNPYDSVKGRRVHTLYGYSPSLLPRPQDYPPHAHVTGYWFLDDGAAWEPPAPLQAFLDAGDPPVYVGFGSLIDRDSRHLIETVVAAVRQAGKRLLLLSGWGDLTRETLSDDVFVIKAAPHDWLFPRMSAIVHHGGAGTTAAALRSGVPSIIVPFFGDQPYWGRLVHRRQVSPRPLPASELSAERLAQALRSIDEPMRNKAAELGVAIRAEDGVGNAVKVIGSLL